MGKDITLERYFRILKWSALIFAVGGIIITILVTPDHGSKVPTIFALAGALWASSFISSRFPWVKIVGVMAGVSIMGLGGWYWLQTMQEGTASGLQISGITGTEVVYILAISTTLLLLLLPRLLKSNLAH